MFKGKRVVFNSKKFETSEKVGKPDKNLKNTQRKDKIKLKGFPIKKNFFIYRCPLKVYKGSISAIPVEGNPFPLPSS